MTDVQDAPQGTATVQPAGLRPGETWRPHEGEEARSLLAHVFEAEARADEGPLGTLPPSGRAVLDVSASILAGGIDPDGQIAVETGLVAGYVQSGKTLSFTTVSALARDNGFHAVIVMTGTSINLFEQSTRRLRADLRLDQPRDRKWLMLSNPRAEHAATLRNILRDWRDPHTPEELKRTALITVMKHHDHLAHLTAMLSELDLAHSPVLVIDDEADQASMNTRVNQAEESTTYSRISSLRAVLPKHTFLQYTATPQAPLLINIIDTLSPNYVRVLDPGSGYTGGYQVFVERRNDVVVEIPANELLTDPHDQDEPPESLIEALRVFLVGVASDYFLRRATRNRSMLVHPSQRRDSHSIYYGWVSRVVEHWLRLLDDQHSEAAREVMQGFAEAHSELSRTVPDLPNFEDLRAQRSIQLAIRNTRIVEVNTRGGNRTPPIPWSDSYGWILVAGQAVDRGFTVEGLTVTYMPRGVGLGNADTLQQRGRFFGYKQGYLGYCRVYLSADTISAFTSYVEHEESVRGQLREYQRAGRPLNEWKRAFLLSPQMRPTRSAVLDLDYMRGLVSDAWMAPSYPLAPADVLEANTWTVQNFLAELDLVPEAGDPRRTLAQQHLVAEDVPLSTVLEDLLVPYRAVASTDNQKFVGLMLQLRRAIDRNPDELCTVYRISPQEQRVRGVDQTGKILNLYQGAYPVANPGRGGIYRGDQHVRTNNRVSVQCHSLTITDPDRNVLAENVQVLAVWVPSRLGRGWIVQDDQ